MLGVLRTWLDKGVDGFRVDAADHLLKDPDLRDNPEASNPSSDLYRSQDHVHDRGHPDIHELFRRIRRLADETPGPPRVLLAEIITRLRINQLGHWAGFFGDLDEATCH